MDNRSNSNIFYIQLVGDLDATNTKAVIEDINIANSKEYVTEINFYLTTYGGDLLYSFALYDHVRFSDKPIDIIAQGVCMSAGVMILQAARKRLSRPHTIFMVHPSISYIEEKSYHEMISIVDQYKKNHELFVHLTIDRSQIGLEDFERLYNPRKYLTPLEAKEFGKHGLIDEIKSPMSQ